MKELDLQKKVCDVVKKDGGFARKWNSPFQAGVPDLILIPKHFGPCFMETKMNANPLTPLQHKTFELITEAGGRVYVLRLREPKKEPIKTLTLTIFGRTPSENITEWTRHAPVLTSAILRDILLNIN